MNPTPDGALAYTLDDAARLCGVSRTLIHRAIKAGHLPAKRTSRDPDGRPTGKYLLLKADLETWLLQLPDDEDVWVPR